MTFNLYSLTIIQLNIIKTPCAETLVPLKTANVTLFFWLFAAFITWHYVLILKSNSGGSGCMFRWLKPVVLWHCLYPQRRRNRVGTMFQRQILHHYTIRAGNHAGRWCFHPSLSSFFMICCCEKLQLGQIPGHLHRNWIFSSSSLTVSLQVCCLGESSSRHSWPTTGSIR